MLCNWKVHKEKVFRDLQVIVVLFLIKEFYRLTNLNFKMSNRIVVLTILVLVMITLVNARLDTRIYTA